MRTKKLYRTVNKRAPKVEFVLWRANEKGYCPVANRELIGICNARIIVKKLLKLTGKQTNLVLQKIQSENKYLIWGKNTEAFFDTKMVKLPEVFYLGVNND